MKNININNRLKQIALLVRPDVVAADIGTDHAYLPIWLVQNEVCKMVISSDINQTPCQRAAVNVSLYGLEHKIKVIQVDGLNGIDKYNPDDIIIAGMGGELIWEIISDSDYVKNNKIRLILQPMTKVSKLRKMLLDNGFNIINETLADEDRRIYEIICVEYSVDDMIRYSDLELLIGRKNIENQHPLLKRHVEKHLKLLKIKKNSKCIDSLIEELRRLL